MTLNTAHIIESRMDIIYLSQICDYILQVMLLNKSYIACELNIINMSALHLDYLPNKQVAQIISNKLHIKTIKGINSNMCNGTLNRIENTNNNDLENAIDEAIIPSNVSKINAKVDENIINIIYNLYENKKELFEGIIANNGKEFFDNDSDEYIKCLVRKDKNKIFVNSETDNNKHVQNRLQCLLNIQPLHQVCLHLFDTFK